VCLPVAFSNLSSTGKATLCLLAQKYSGVSTYICSSDANVSPICELELMLRVEAPHHFELMLMVVAFCVSPHNRSYHAARGSHVCFDVLMCSAYDVLRSNSKLVLSVHEFFVLLSTHFKNCVRFLFIKFSFLISSRISCRANEITVRNISLGRFVLKRYEHKNMVYLTGEFLIEMLCLTADVKIGASCWRGWEFCYDCTA